MTSATSALMSVALTAVDQAAEVMRTALPGELTAKGDRDMASEVDLRIERETRDYLAGQAPGIGFLGEEQGHTGDRDHFWALDPVDGTANFVRGLPLCAVSLALVEDNQPTLGVIALPFLGTVYRAERGGGAWDGTRRLRASQTTELGDAIVAVGDYAVGEDADRKNRLRLAVTRQLAEKVQRVRMLGSAAIDLAWVADGKLDASITLSNKPWDTAAGVLLAKEAGAQVTDRDGASHRFDSSETLALTTSLLNDLLALLHGAMASLSF